MRGEGADEVIETLVAMRREVGTLRRALAAHRSALTALTHPELEALGNHASGERFQSLMQRFEATVQEARDAREAIVGSFDVLIARTGHRTNHIMKVLTLTSVILLPGALIAGLMGMNFKVGLFKAQDWMFYVVLALTLAFAPITVGVAKLAQLDLIVQLTIRAPRPDSHVSRTLLDADSRPKSSCPRSGRLRSAKCPQRDSNPRYGLERAVTWAASRWGRRRARLALGHAFERGRARTRRRVPRGHRGNALQKLVVGGSASRSCALGRLNSERQPRAHQAEDPLEIGGGPTAPNIPGLALITATGLLRKTQVRHLGTRRPVERVLQLGPERIRCTRASRSVDRVRRAERRRGTPRPQRDPSPRRPCRRAGCRAARPKSRTRPPRGPRGRPGGAARG